MLFAGRTKWPYGVHVTPTSTVTSDLYFDLSLLTNFWTKVRSDGGDIRVFKQDGVTPVAREVSGFDYANKRGSLFIATSGATAFYITCGTGAAEPAPDSTYGKYAVWESAAKLVAHLEANANDSTANAITFVDTDVSYSAAKIKNGGNYNGTTSYSLANVPASVKTSNFAVFMWVYLSSNSLKGAFFHNGRNTTGGGYTGYALGVGNTNLDNNGNKLIGLYDGMAWKNFYTNIGTGWHWVGMVNDGGVLTGYIDNVACVTTFTGDMNTPTANTVIGGDAPAEGVAGARYFPGGVDEIVLLDRVPTSAERATMYANQNDPASFWTIGAEG